MSNTVTLNASRTATMAPAVITAVEDDVKGLEMVDEEHPVDHDEIPGPLRRQGSDTIAAIPISSSRGKGILARLGLSRSNGSNVGSTSQLKQSPNIQKSSSSERMPSIPASSSLHHRHKNPSAPQLRTLVSNVSELDLSTTEHPEWSGLGILASRTDLEVPAAIFAAGCNLLQAAALGKIAEMEQLLQQGITNVNFRDYDRRTALHVAASEGRLDVCQFLVLKCNARINRSDRWGGSPLDDAHRHQHKGVVQFLRQHGATTGSGNRSTNLIAAAAEGDTDEVQLLLQMANDQMKKAKEKGKKATIDINKSDYDRRTALHLAAGEGHVSVVELLCEAGADVNAEDRWHRRPLDDAIANEQQACREVLEFLGAAPGPNPMELNETIGNGEELDDSGKRVDDNLKVDFKELELVDRIGSGAFGEIYKCRWRGTLVAAKIIKSTKIRGDWMKKQMLDSIKRGKNVDDAIKEMDEADAEEMAQADKDEAIADFRREISLLKTLRHPHITLLLAYSTTENYELIMSELMKCSLLDVFRSHIVQGTKMPHRQQIAYATQLALGMNYLHNCKPPIIHRDLKPANLLLDHSGVLKISDFGLSKVRPDPTKKETEKYVMTGETGSYRFMAPEVFRHEEYNETVDVYSFAMIFFYLLVGRPPWPNLSGIEAVKRAADDGDRPTIPRELDVRLTTLLKESWDENASHRPSFNTIIEFFYQYNEDVFKVKSSDTFFSSSEAAASCCTIL